MSDEHGTKFYRPEEVAEILQVPHESSCRPSRWRAAWAQVRSRHLPRDGFPARWVPSARSILDFKSADVF
jgi:hypothetical protein